MKILITGSQGGVGTVLVEELLGAGHEVRTLDRKTAPTGCSWEHVPGDVRDLSLVRRLTQGTDTVFHLAADLNDTGVNQESTFTVNTQGTWNILMACIEAGIRRLVYFSSIQALGHSNPAHTQFHFPIDDQIPKQPATPYQISKHAAEEICRGFTVTSDLTIACLRPTYIYVPESAPMRWQLPYDELVKGGRRDYWSYVHVRDVCQAAIQSMDANIEGFQGFLLTSDYVWADIPTANLVSDHYPHVSWHETAMEQYVAENPYRSLVDCRDAKEVLGWQPVFSTKDLLMKEIEASDV